MLFSCVAIIIMLFILRFKITYTAIFSFVPMILVLIFSIGLGLILASANIFFRDINHLYSVWLTAWLYLTPIIYPIDMVSKKIQMIIKLNPMYYYVNYFRDVIIYNKIPGLNFNLICLIYSFGFLLLGMIIFKANQDKFILYV